MQSIKLEVEDDVYAKFTKLEINIEEEFQKFLLHNLEKENGEEQEPKEKSMPNYWDALASEIQAIKKINSKIFTKYKFKSEK